MMIDDDDINNEVNSLLIHNFDPNIEIVKYLTVDDGLNYLRNNPDKLPELIFCDINLPHKNGWDFLQEFKTLQLDIDVYMLTSSLDILDRNIEEQHPDVSGFIEKPLYDYKIKDIFNK